MMRGTEFAMLFSTITWLTCCLISFYYFSYRYSKKIIPKKIRNITTEFFLNKLLIFSFIISPIIGGLTYYIGGNMEYGNGIAWGCYIENFWIITILLWLFFLLLLLIFSLISLAKPAFFGFENKKRIFKFFVLQNSINLIYILLIGFFIPIISGPLSGISSSCL